MNAAMVIFPEHEMRFWLAFSAARMYNTSENTCALEVFANMKKFNVTGLCVPTKHYMVDISGKIEQILKLVHDGQYFTINRARQYGKTTTLNQLEKSLSKDEEYLCANISFEEMGLADFDTESAFCDMFLSKISEALYNTNVQRGYARKWRAKKWFGADISTLELLSRHITKMCKDKKTVLIIDEVDKSANNRLFLHFLGMLRAKYLNRQAGSDNTFHSVILAGVTDIKNLKLKMINDGIHSRVAEEGRIFNSPWNIAASFDVDMSFSSEEISTMLDDYESDHKTGMDIKSISEEIHKFTSGYPMLTSRICQCIDEELDGNWTIDGVSEAAKIIIDEKNVLFDDLAKNLENNRDLYEFLYDILIIGESKPFTHGNRLIDLADMFGYISRNPERKNVVISNKIFEVYMTNYFISYEDTFSKNKSISGVLCQDVIHDNVFDMELCLRKFAEHYTEIFVQQDMPFLERHGRLLFLSYIRPLINGQGFYHIESQFTDLRRMDVVVDFGKDQFIIELKLWKGEAAKEEAYNQLLGYMQSKNAIEGYLLTFDFRKNAQKERKAEWVDFGEMKIFDVVV